MVRVYFILVSLFLLSPFAAPLCLASSDENRAEVKQFSFERFGLVEDRCSACIPTAVVLKFAPSVVLDQAYKFYIGINLLTYDALNPLRHIGYISGEVIAGECPSRYSDGIYEKHGKHIRIAHFDMNEGYQSIGMGKYVLKQFFTMFDPIKLPYKLEINDDNMRAQRFFAKYGGFKIVTDVEGCHFDRIHSYMKHNK